MKLRNLLISTACGILFCCAAPLHAAAAGTVDDVYAAMREIGLSEAMVQQAKNQYQTIPHDSAGMEINGHYATYDVWAQYVYIYEDQIWAEINKQFTVTTSSATTAATSPAGSSETQTTTTSARSAAERKSFINMTLEEKKAYVAALPPEEQEAFLRSLSTAERNSIIKQLGTESQAEIAQGFIALAQQLGMNITVDSIGGQSGIDYSVRDGDGNLIDSSVIGTQVDDTGWDTTVPVLGGCGAILFSVGGMLCTGKKGLNRKEEEANG